MTSKSDVRAALTQLEQDDPFARERYRRDPQFRADVNEHARRARAMAEHWKGQARHALLRQHAQTAASSPGDADNLHELLDAMSQRDTGYRAALDYTATGMVLNTLKSLGEGWVPPMPDNTTKH